MMGDDQVRMNHSWTSGIIDSDGGMSAKFAPGTQLMVSVNLEDE